MNAPQNLIQVVQGDLAQQDVDAVVNAANEHLRHGGGVAAALARAGGPAIQQESDAWVREHGPLDSGHAAITSAGALPARWIVHVAGPRYSPDQDNRSLLRAAVNAALSAAAGVGAQSVALPAISSGIFGYPSGEATSVIADTCRDWIDRNPDVMSEIRLVGYEAETVAAFEKAML
ncbi:MAG: macro domain-containing protein [Acidimicrobiia bacterium]|nr:macro domain-containing protein [Acidimicrobiia bacterium]